MPPWLRPTPFCSTSRIAWPQSRSTVHRSRTRSMSRPYHGCSRHWAPARTAAMSAPSCSPGRAMRSVPATLLKGMGFVSGGLGLVLASDIAVCSENATFFASWMANGVANDGGSSYTLAKIVGFRRAMELMLTNRTLTAKEAVEWQICNRMYRNEEFSKNVTKIARQLAQGPTHLQAYVKETFHEGWRRSLEECTEYECQNILTSLDHPYAAERLAEFKRGQRTNPLMIDLM